MKTNSDTQNNTDTEAAALPLLQPGECGSLRVVDINDNGVWLDQGLPEDLFMPWAEQRRPREIGQYETVLVYRDNSGRLAASSRIDHHLDDRPAGFQPWDKVSLLVFQRTDLGFKAVIDNRAIGLLYKDEVFRTLRVGQRVPGYVKRIREDGRIDLSLQPRSRELTDQLERQVLERLTEHGGRLDLSDGSPPEAIREAFGTSKKAFKRALSSLYKSRRIVIERDHIRLPD
ncbi:MAG: GntR family transcriptional regulator [Gammaproteobacteria bacterium]|nr:MAG: GntR family transcriptional regulator [Gammaproteobacteria bacterium]